MADDRPQPPLPPDEPESVREDAPPAPRQIPGSGTPTMPPQGDVRTGQPIPGVNAAQASYPVPTGSPLDHFLANLGPAQAAPPSADALIRHYLARRGGNVQLAFADLSDARAQDPTNLALRNAEHALFTQQVINQLGLPNAAALATPAYSAAKAVGQPLGLFKGATPPSLQEVQYGLWPLLRQLGLMR